MSKQIQIRRGSATEHEDFTGALGEVTMDTTNKTLRVHDGETAGGIAIAKQNELDNIKNYLLKIDLDWDNKIDCASTVNITINKSGFMLCRGSTYSLDWVEADFKTEILREYILSNNYTTVWAPVYEGQHLKQRQKSEYSTSFFIPYKSISE